MPIMDEHSQFQKQFVRVQWCCTIAVSEQGLFQHEISCVFQSVSRHYFVHNENVGKLFLSIVLFFFHLIKQKQARVDGAA